MRPKSTSERSPNAKLNDNVSQEDRQRDVSSKTFRCPRERKRVHVDHKISCPVAAPVDGIVLTLLVCLSSLYRDYSDNSASSGESFSWCSCNMLETRERLWRVMYVGVSCIEQCGTARSNLHYFSS